MYQVEVVYDETNSTLRWLRVSHNGASWSSIQIRSNEEALQIITALQQSVQRTGQLCECSDRNAWSTEVGSICIHCELPRR